MSRVVHSSSHGFPSVEIWIRDRWQIKAVVVGKGVEIQHNPDLNGWVRARTLRKWCKAVVKLSEECVPWGNTK